MSREKEGFREQLDRLDAKYPGKEVLSIKEASEYLDTDRHCLTNDKDFPAKKVGGKLIIPKVALARYLCTI
jgi:hypothetical protein